MSRMCFKSSESLSGSVSSDISENSGASVNELRKEGDSCLSYSGWKRANDRYQIIEAICAQQPTILAPAGQVQYQPKFY